MAFLTESLIKYLIMKKVFTLMLFLFFTGYSVQAQNIQTPPASKQAEVAEWIGLSKVSIQYHRPGVKGREGNIFGGPVVPLDGSSPLPWRAGADENTVIYFENDVTINGNPLPAGKYGFHILPTENDWTLIFSNNHHSWGSYFYNESEDALRINIKPTSCDFMEWLSYDFINQTDNSVDIRMRWDQTQVSFTVGSDVHAVTLAKMEKQLQGLDGFNPQSYAAAAQYCLGVNKDLEKALFWSDRSMDRNFGGQKTFTTVSTRALVLDRLGRTTEADTAFDEALAMGTMQELHFLGRAYIQNEKPDKAMKVFKYNREKNPDDKFTTLVGMARGGMAIGEYKSAAKHFRMAAENAPQGQATYYEDLAKQCENKMQTGG